jgi:hypothetical protein
MNPFLLVAENKILEAIENGEFDNFPGQGEPMELLEDPHVPAEYRMVQHILKNAGYAEREDGYFKQLKALRDETQNLDPNSKEALMARLTDYRNAELLAREHRRRGK